jgi:hypothetical protein
MTNIDDKLNITIKNGYPEMDHKIIVCFRWLLTDHNKTTFSMNCNVNTLLNRATKI